MSFSNPKQTNPAVKFIEWSGSKGNFYYYDKEKGENIAVSLPVYFIVLDELHTVSGYSKFHKSGIVSNEVRDSKKDDLHVRTWARGISEIAPWQQIKSLVPDAKYCKSVYALLLMKDDSELVNFKLYGSAFSGSDSSDSRCKSGWINVKFNTEQYGVMVKRTENGVNGNTEFIAPLFERVKINEGHRQKAIEADRELQEYLDYYFKQDTLEQNVLEEITKNNIADAVIETAKTQETQSQSNENEDEIDDLPF